MCLVVFFKLTFFTRFLGKKHERRLIKKISISITIVYKIWFILKQSGIPITPAQIDALIAYLDRDGDGEIDFR